MTPQKESERLGDDLLMGCRNIAEYLNLTEAEVRWHIQKGHLSVSRMGRLHVARKSELAKRFTPETAA
jgi:hypothetical protein